MQKQQKYVFCCTRKVCFVARIGGWNAVLRESIYQIYLKKIFRFLSLSKYINEFPIKFLKWILKHFFILCFFLLLNINWIFITFLNTACSCYRYNRHEDYLSIYQIIFIFLYISIHFYFTHSVKKHFCNI